MEMIIESNNIEYNKEKKIIIKINDIKNVMKMNWKLYFNLYWKFKYQKLIYATII